MKEDKKIKKLMLLGLIGAVITVFAEMLQGASPSSDTTDRMSTLFSSFDTLAVWRIGVGSTVGALGILMQFAGVYGIFLSFKDKTTRWAKIYEIGMYVFSILGAIVHVLMSMMVYVYKIDFDMMIDFTVWFVAPILVLFFLGYIPFAVAMSVQFYRLETPFPKWFFLFNPLFGKIFFSAVTTLLPSSALTNGISYSNMGLSSVILFGAALIYLYSGKAEKSCAPTE